MTWPNMDVDLALGAPLGTQGWQQEIVIPDPAPGVAVVGRRVPGNAWERIVTAHIHLVTDAVVANRSLFWQILDGDGLIVVNIVATQPVPASSAVDVTIALGLPAATSAAGVSITSLADIVLASGWTWQFAATGLDPGDQLSGLRAMVQRLPTGQAF